MDVRLLGDCGKMVPKSMLRRRRSESVEIGNTNCEVNSEENESRSTREYSNGHLHPTPELTTYGGIKLGWIQGVLIPCLLNIWGVMLFLRIAWVVAQAGIGLSVIIVFLSAIVCVITTLSLSAICTNGQLQGGGVYYLVSRSLGAEFGASVGILFAFANAVAASMNTIGFCDSLNHLLKTHGLKIVDNDVNDIRIVGAVALLVMCVICAIGMDWETKAQNFLIVVIVVAIINYIVGALIGPSSDVERAKGFVGINLQTIRENWLPNFRYSEGREHDFFSVFAVYFPAVTGVQAGANICGDLKNPAVAIPKGTLLALAISVTSYFTMVILSGMGALRDASGNVANLTTAALESCKPHCGYGLHNNYAIMQLMSAWGPFIYAGCWAATLSTALTNLLSVPRLIQALGVDRIYPGLIFFSKPYGRHGEPYRGYVLTFFVSLLFLLIANLNAIAPLITNFYLASYALINFCTFHAAFVHQINWRPTFRYYNKWLSLAGFLMCASIMMIISWAMALTTMFVFMTLYLLVLYRKPDVSWGSSTEGQRYQDTVSFITELSHRVTHSRSYNPQLLVLAGTPLQRPALIDVAHMLTKIGSFMIVADITDTALTKGERVSRQHIGEQFVKYRKLRAFYVLLQGLDLKRGANALMQASGLGKLSPNILLIGFKKDWTNAEHKQISDYYGVIQDAFDLKLAVTILRVPGTSQTVQRWRWTPRVVSEPNNFELVMHTQVLALMNSDSDLEDDDQAIDDDSDKLIDSENQLSNETSSSEQNPESIGGEALRSANFSRTSRRKLSNGALSFRALSFNCKQYVDAWWLYEDGGLNILLPYIIARRGYKHKLPLRIFAITKEQHKREFENKCMESLLKKFRIEYTELTLVRGIGDAPPESSWKMFNNIINDFKSEEKTDILTSEAELKSQYSKTSRHLRLRNLLLQHSTKAAIVIITLPLPRKVSASLYMAWLEVLSRDLPPVLFVRGNDSCVLDA
ncbi:bumetanide-sensitive sodium-(potassium)-chloride cotransporter isoform X1 [Bombyx mori]|uniref:Bumetanide-sensitive sodium-(Potassium)-chloride cotransporter n=2 Tax=Bombyx mori TaxID=7091 RepID=A0A8R1WLY8_BOMMO|nr:bumetanide-sensitive sodium-(potassium)-chloride cotransporter isoform X1 [Bombyx mori]